MSGWQRARPIAGFDRVFVRYVRGLARASFAGVWTAGEASLPAGGYIAVANHHSWWDGFIPYLLHHREKKAGPFAIMMSDRELRRFPYFRFGGAFSIDASTARRARASIAYAAEEARRGTAVWIFPDGVLRPATALPSFTSGFVHAAREAGVPIVPVGMRFVFLDRQRPEVFVRYGPPIDARLPDARSNAEHAVALLLARIDGDLERNGRDAFAIAIAGRSGIDDRVALSRR